LDRHAELIETLPVPSVVFSVDSEPTLESVLSAVAAARDHAADIVQTHPPRGIARLADSRNLLGGQVISVVAPLSGSLRLVGAGW
jgi:hypothetical protein